MADDAGAAAGLGASDCVRSAGGSTRASGHSWLDVPREPAGGVATLSGSAPQLFSPHCQREHGLGAGSPAARGPE
jgi:hypothetical protein